MITKINKLKRFGIYQDYSWGAIDDFKKKNLVYGWNYSGKTTLSKLFQILEFKDKNKFFNGSEFEISFNEGGAKTVNQESVSTFPYFVKVFNSEYIKRIFIWDEPKAGFNPISFYLGDAAGDLKGKINKLETINLRLSQLRDKKYLPIIETFDNYNKKNGQFTDKAKDFRNNYLPGLFDPTTFDKGHLKLIADTVKSDLESYILSSAERDFTKKDATAEKRYDLLNESIKINENLISLTQLVKSILEDTAPKSLSIPELENSPDLFEWVQKGIPFHIDADECKFCSKPLPEDRIDNLNSFYSKKLMEIQEAIHSANKSIDEEKKLIDVKFPIKKDIAETLQVDYGKAIQSYQEAKLKYEIQLGVLEKDLKTKGSSIFNSMNATKIDEISLQIEFEKIEGILKSHNEWLEKFAERKDSATKNILNHYVAEYLMSENYIQKETNRECAAQTIEKINIKVKANLELIAGFNTQLSDKVKGQKELNDILEILLHRDDIKIEIREEKFRLERSGHPAENLSEGEKSAIAFAYFLTELKALRDDEPTNLPKTIIFLDDPISSLDSNHIFQVRSLLKDFFKTDDFAQLFISTHNFEFFSIMYDSKIFSKTQNEINRPLYLIKRDKNGLVTIDKMPKSFSNYKSEYVGLFHILKEFNESTDKEDFPYLLLLPNALRRFVELYTLSKYPANNDSTVDSRVEIVFKSADKPHHNIKLLNWFSHQNQFEKLLYHDDKLLQIVDAIGDLIDYIEKEDELHWKGLNGL